MVMQSFGGKQGALWCLWKWWIPYLPFSLTSSSLLLAPYSCKASCKRTQHCWLTTPNIVGCYMLRPFAHPVACCCVLLRKFWNQSNFSPNNSQHFFCSAWADPGFFLGGGALVSCATSTPLNHIVFFFCRIPVVLETAGHLRGEGGAHALHPPPRSAPVLWSLKRRATMLDPFARFFQHCRGHARSLRMDYKDLWVVFLPRRTAGPKLVGSCCIRFHTTANTHAPTPNIVAPVCTQPKRRSFVTSPRPRDHFHAIYHVCRCLLQRQ